MRSNLHRKSSSVQHQDVITGDFPNYSTPPFMQRKGVASAATINDPINGMGVTFEEDEDKLSNSDSVIANPQPQQQISIHIENDALQSSKHRQYSSNSIPEMHFIEPRNCISKPVTPTNGHGNLIVNKCAIYENYVNDDDELSGVESDRNKYLQINNLAINKKSKFKSKSANSIAITHTNNLQNNNNNLRNNSNHKSTKNNPNGTITSSSSKQSIEYVINDRANRKFLQNFNFSGSKGSNSCSGVIGLGLTTNNNIDHCPYNDPKIVCKIVDRN